MTRIPTVLVAAVLTLMAAGCGDRVGSSFVGNYAMVRNGVLNDFIRIDYKGDGFVVSLKQGEAWVSPTTVTHLEKEKLEALIKQAVTVTYESLGNERVVLLKLPAGARIGDFETKTGFAWATEFGLVEVHKR